MSNPIETSLPRYVEEKAGPLIAESVLGAKSAKLFTLQPNVKKSQALNLLSTDVVFGDGAGCGWDPAGSQTLSQRILTVGNIKINMSYCPKQLLNTYLGSEIKVAAGSESMPFEEKFIGEVVNSIKEGVEKLIYQGDTSSPDSLLKWTDGLLKILNAETGVVDVTASTETNTYAKIRKIYKAIPEETYTRGEVVILVGNDVFRTFTDDLVDKNLYHYNPGTPEGEVLFPGTMVRVIGVNGLNGTNKAIAASLKNLFYGTDMADDEEKFEFWWSQDNREFRLDVEFNAGVQVAFPDEIVLGTL